MEASATSGTSIIPESDTTTKLNSLYSPLDDFKRSIRLLKIVSTDPNIECELKVISLTESPVFSALSYVWGDASITETISVNETQMQVTVNLANAIRGVHHQWKYGAFNADALSAQWLWADAVCINQNDTKEKNHQVPLMKEIYSKAQRVFSWLGPEDQQIHRAFDAMHIIWSEISKLPFYADLLHKATTERPVPKYEFRSLITLVEQKELFYELGSMDWIAKYNPLDAWEVPYSERRLNLFPVLTFFYADYWNRLWIFQEVVMAQELSLLCGTRQLPWLELSTAMSWLEAARQRYPEKHPRQICYADWVPVQLFNQTTFTTIIEGKRLSQVRMHDDHHSGFCSRSFNLSLRLTLYQVTDARDYIYGQEGIIKLGIVPDYSETNTAADVYKDFASLWLSHRQKRPRVNESDMLDDLWFFSVAGVGFLWKGLPGLPSWAPNFVATAGLEKREHKTRFSTISGAADRGVFSKKFQRPKISSSSLFCASCPITHIAELGPLIPRAKFSELAEDTDSAFYLWLFNKAVKLSKHHHSSSRNYAILMFAGAILDVISKPEEVLLIHDVLVDIAEQFCTDCRNMDVGTFFELPRMEHPTPMEKIEERGLKKQYLGRRPSALMKKAGEGTWRTLWLKSMSKRIGLSVAETATGVIGVFPPLTQEGDVIAILDGCVLPAVLRKLGDHYIFVGLSYISGLMNSEAKKLLEAGEATVEEIEIR